MSKDSLLSDVPHPVLRRLADEVAAGACTAEQALTAAFQLGYIQRDVHAAEANRRAAYACPECCDTGCVVDESLVPTAVTEGDTLVPCPHCSSAKWTAVPCSPRVVPIDITPVKWYATLSAHTFSAIASGERSFLLASAWLHRGDVVRVQDEHRAGLVRITYNTQQPGWLAPNCYLYGFELVKFMPNGVAVEETAGSRMALMAGNES